MSVRRIVPNIASAEPDLCREFYCGLLGLQPAMDMGWIATYVSPVNPTAQISVVRGPATGARSPADHSPMSLTVEVEDVDHVHSQAVARGCRIVYPLTDEAWGVRRFGVEDPNGVVINIMSHKPASPTER